MKKKIIGIFVCTLLIVATVIPVAGNIKTETTSPLFAINTSVDKISPYNIPSSYLTITATGPNDIDDVTLYYRWSKDNITWTGMQEFSIYENFESGSQNTSLWGLYQSPGDTRTQFNYATAHDGNYSCAMDDDDTATGDSELNEIYTVYDFTDAMDINFEFWHADADDEANPSPASWDDHGNYDAVSFTNDGTTWYELFDTDTTPDLSDNSGSIVWEYFTYNINNHSNFNPSVDSNFAIKFQQYDNYHIDPGASSDGRLWDDINIEYTIGAPSSNWSFWIHGSNPDTSYPWSWYFNFPNNTGYYEFYSIGKIIGGEVETAPLVADAQCRYTRSPEVFNENPSNGSTDVQIFPELDISISDADGDTMTINWYSNSSGSWKCFGSNKNIGDGTYSQTNSNFSDYDTTYWWYVTVADNIYTISSPIFHFTTEENVPPNTPSEPDPEDGATGVSIQEILTWTGGDPNQGDKVYYDVYFGTSSSPPMAVEDLLYTAYDPGTMELETTYYWKIVAEDSQGETAYGSIWSFTTEAETNYPPTTPKIYGPPSGPPGLELCWAFVSNDPEEKNIKYIIEWGDGDSIETDYYPDGMVVEACHTYEEQGEYSIKAKAEDEKGLVGDERTFFIKIQKPRTVYHPLLLRLFEQFPILERLLGLIIT